MCIYANHLVTVVTCMNVTAWMQDFSLISQSQKQLKPQSVVFVSGSVSWSVQDASSLSPRNLFVVIPQVVDLHSNNASAAGNYLSVSSLWLQRSQINTSEALKCYCHYTGNHSRRLAGNGHIMVASPRTNSALYRALTNWYNLPLNIRLIKKNHPLGRICRWWTEKWELQRHNWDNILVSLRMSCITLTFSLFKHHLQWEWKTGLGLLDPHVCTVLTGFNVLT